MNPNEYQNEALRTASGMDEHFSENGIFIETTDGHVLANANMLLNGVLGLTGESGEVIDIVKKCLFQGHIMDVDHMKEELGDVAWYLAICCAGCGLHFEDVLQNNVDKLRKRYPDGFEAERSVNRDKYENQ